MPSKDLTDWKLRSLERKRLEALRKFFRFQNGPHDRAFFENVVWWWRPLSKILGPRARHIEIPSVDRRRHFPEFVFEQIQFSEAIDGVHDLVEYWFSNELGARLAAPDVKWPTLSLISLPFQGWKEWAFGVRPKRQIDLRKSDAELLGEYHEELKLLREERRDRIPMPADGHNRKQSWFTPSSFTAIELIDRKLFFGEQIDNDTWANVRKAVRRFTANYRH